jgi:hypothetical protein
VNEGARMKRSTIVSNGLNRGALERYFFREKLVVSNVDKPRERARFLDSRSGERNDALRAVRDIARQEIQELRNRLALMAHAPAP